MNEISRIIEAILFVADKPVTVNKLVLLLPNFKKEEIENGISDLNEVYKDHAINILEIAGGFQLATRPEYHEYIKKFNAVRIRPRLSQAALETLAVITYKQPVSRVEVEAIRGVNSDGVVGTLLERGMIEILGRADTVGKPLLYGTTQELLQYFGLKNYSELPNFEEIEALLKAREEEEKIETIQQPQIPDGNET